MTHFSAIIKNLGSYQKSSSPSFVETQLAIDLECLHLTVVETEAKFDNCNKVLGCNTSTSRIDHVSKCKAIRHPIGTSKFFQSANGLIILRSSFEIINTFKNSAWKMLEELNQELFTLDHGSLYCKWNAVYLLKRQVALNNLSA